MVEESQKRQIAVKTRIADLTTGRYVKEAGWMPNYILTEKGEKISRINLVAVIVTDPIVDISYRSILIDDGSGKMSIRDFQENKMFDTLKLGDPVFVIGRPREYNGQVYIHPEIIKKITNTKWIEVRKFELEQINRSVAAIPGDAAGIPSQPQAVQPVNPEGQSTQSMSQENKPVHPTQQAAVTVESIGDAPTEEAEAKPAQVTEEIAEEKKEPPEAEPITEQKEKAEEEPDISKKIYNNIKDLDKGNGADYEEVISKSGSIDSERIIALLLKEGEIFEVSPGKLKVLE